MRIFALTASREFTPARYRNFVSGPELKIQALMEKLVHELFKTVLSVELPSPIPQMSYADAIRRYGSDKPDLRIAS